MTQHK